ncbi:MAG: twin-arginine translocase subunit TatC [Burkholderiales bacterium]|jgi:sec-independent protein translocase protein TatC|nr:twin-arginine translocase subunit TatC [Burkholderiales bacterium]
MSTSPDNEQTSAATGEEQSFISHLVELRQRLVRAALAVLAVFLCLTPFMKQIFDLLSRPMMVALPEGTKLLATGVITPFMVPLKLTLFTAFVIALPYVLYQTWAFVAPGLYKHEKRLAAPIIVSSVGMFLLGMTYCYFIVFGFVFKFIAGFAPASVAVAPDIEAYFSFVLGMFLAFGLAFEMPVVVVLLARFGIASLDALRKARPYVIVGAFIVAAIFTPPDVLSQLLLAIPLCLLYELGLQIARFLVKPAPAAGADEAAAS